MVSSNRTYLIFGVLLALTCGDGVLAKRGRPDRARGKKGGPPTDDDLEQQKERLSIKSSKKLKPEKVEEEMIEVDGQFYSLRRKDLVPFQPPITGSTVFMINGKEKNRPPQSHLFTSKDDPSVLLVFGTNGKLKRASKGKGKGSGGKSKTMVIPIDDDPEYFVEFSEDDLDYEELNQKYTLGEAQVPLDSAGRSLSSSLRSAAPMKSTGNDANRELQGACNTFDEVEVAIAFDSYFCDDFGGESEAIDRVYEIVETASKYYEANNVCFTLVVSIIDGFCGHTSADPYKSMVDSSNNIGCGGEGLLDKFQDYWNANRPQSSYPRDTAHLFYGKDVNSGSSTIGCAYINAICNTNWGYGVNEMSHNNAPTSFQEQLFAHELGHNVGANHDSGCSFQNTATQFIMCPFITSSTFFSSTSASAFQTSTSGKSCVASVPAGGSTNPPTKAPTKSPTISPTKAPVAPNGTPAPTPPPNTPSSDVDVTFYIAFDYWPEDNGFQVTAVDDINDVYYNVPTGTWANQPSFGAVAVTFQLPANQDFTLHFFDAYGDGIGWMPMVGMVCIGVLLYPLRPNSCWIRTFMVQLATVPRTSPQLIPRPSRSEVHVCIQ